MDNIIITGGTGFIGQRLAQHLTDHGFNPILIARHPPNKNKFQFVQWDGATTGDWIEVLSGAKAIVNLAGKTVDCIKTPDNCDLILRSRVDSTKAIGSALRQLPDPPKVWVQMSTAHIYGDPPTQMCTESSSFGYGLAPFVGRAWESAFLESKPADTRGVILRTSFVIGKDGGALASLRKIVRLGLGGRVGHGRQGISWIHEDDLNALILRAVLDDNYSGAYIASSPNPVANRDFMRCLRKAMKMPIGLAAPSWITRLGARFLFKTDPELALYGRYVTSERLELQGFAFKYPKLQPALASLMK